ncbi:DNA-binding protein [Patescibacteria group bacterium]|nr:DNA-binding protein [Patescibacteria group bacterium]MBU2219661.1 DNA-binding protein [Patescibacteria group bacterium]MBU2264800.1 DNA-binding protein [Patescibacteria group bacterium]
MTHKQFGNKYIVRVAKGEELVKALKDFCRENDIKLGVISGLGAADKITLGLFKTKTKEYSPKEFLGDFELTSVLGNISRMNGEIYLHLHATISDEACQAFGGHLTSAVISGTFEGVIEKIDGEIGRKYNEDIGLNLYDF